MRALSHFLAGVLFAVGLAVSGMTRPDKVVGFLDVFGAWDPSLAFVMGGAVLVNFGLFRWTMRRKAPVFAPQFHLPVRTALDPALIGGAVLFGAGWGLGGFCPGPALTSISVATPSVLTFVGAMFAGMWLFRLYELSRQRAAASASPSPVAHAAPTAPESP